MSSNNPPREAASSPFNPLDLLKAIATQNIPFFDGTDLPNWLNHFELYSKKHRVKQGDRFEEREKLLLGRQQRPCQHFVDMATVDLKL
ncbi:hypothetical protein DSO57_1017743 [Entomophthora muscae]|uniref:Uncharacterized protein n=1 Tax=Entomophthora muscae TaxID=34485 RepID=A0ACC2UQ77_9FUNG|nr:hypothetical protein DSO57_1017743 [Entomophthora muscae]